MELTVPKEVKPVIQRFIKLPAQSIDSLVQALAITKPTLTVEKLIAEIEKNSSLPANEVQAYIRAFLGMAIFVQTLAKTELEFASALTESLSKDNPDLKPADQSWASFAAQLAQILAAPAIRISSHALDVLTESEHVFQSVRIISDIRPIFDSELSATPPAALIIHHLNIAFKELDSVRQISIALDSSDLESLRSVLDRALIKEETLRRLILKDGLQCLETTDATAI